MHEIHEITRIETPEQPGFQHPPGPARNRSQTPLLKHLRHESIPDPRPVIHPFRRQHPTPIRQDLANNRRATVEHPDIQLVPTRPRPLHVPHHIFVVRVEDPDKVRSTEMRRIDKPSQRRLGVFFRPMQLEEPTVDMRRDGLPLLRDVRLDTNVEVGVRVVLVVPLLGMRDSIEEILKPQQITLVPDCPVEIDTTVVDGEDVAAFLVFCTIVRSRPFAPRRDAREGKAAAAGRMAFGDGHGRSTSTGEAVGR